MYGLTALLRSDRGDVVTLTCNWSTPANFALTVDCPGRRLELRPFERATVYEGMEVFEPSDEIPIRRYVPRAVAHVDLEAEDLVQKPGFLRQASVFRAMIEGASPPPETATLADAEAALKLAEQLLGASHPCQGLVPPTPAPPRTQS